MPWIFATRASARKFIMFCLGLLSPILAQVRNYSNFERYTFIASIPILIGVILANALPAYGQAPPGLPPGLPPFATFSSGDFGTVNLANLNIHFEIPLRSLPGREFPLNLSLIYDVTFATPAQQTTGVIYWRTSAANYTTSNPRAGNWEGSGFLPGQVQFDSNSVQCYSSGTSTYTPYTTYTNFRYLDTHGTIHYFPSNLSVDAGTCPSIPHDDDGGQVGAEDGSQYTLYITQGTGAPGAYVKDASGTIDEAIDTNGNSNTNTFYGLQTGSATDSSGNTAMSLTGTSNSATFSYMGPDGNAKNIVATLSSIPIATVVGCPHIPDPSDGPSETALTNLAFPDGTSYSFTYDSMGRPLSITLPTGGTISYSYNAANGGISCVDGGFSSLKKVTPDGTWNYARSYDTTTSLWTTTVIDPLGNQTIYTFGGAPFTAWSLGSSASSAEYETQRKIYQNVNGTQVLLKTLVTCYNGNFTNCATDPNPSTYTTSSGYALPIAPVQKDVYTYLPGVSGPSLSETVYKGEGASLSEDKEYDFGASVPPGSNFISDRNLTYGTCAGYEKPCTDITKDSSGTTLASATYQYDSAGNELSESHLAQGSTYVITQHSYTANGLISTTTDPNNTVTTYTYSCNGAFPTTTTVSGMLTTTQWNCAGEVPSSITDPNNKVTNFKYVNSAGTGDPFWRLIQTNYPDGGQITNTYSDAGRTISTAALENAGSSLTSSRSFDVLGRPSVSTAASGAITKTTYNSVGLVASITNPYFSTSDPTYGITSFTYDALGRKLYQCQPDNGTGSGPCVPGVSYLKWTYSGSTTAFTDEDGNSWTRTNDALGRLINLAEPGGLETAYTYDGLNNLLRANQTGLSGDTPRLRTFSYDGLSRLISATNPETGTVSYGYDGNGNVTSKTDARGITTSYHYDSLNRLTSKTYSGGNTVTASSCYQYDTGNGSGNFIGRLVNEWTMPRSGTCTATLPTNGYLTRRSILAYDLMGRIQKEQQCHLSSCTTGVPYTNTRTYDLAGNPTSFTSNVHSISFGESYNTAGQLLSLSSAWDDSTHPGGLLSVGAYTAFGAIETMTLGPNINVTKTYNNRLRITGETAAHP